MRELIKRNEIEFGDVNDEQFMDGSGASDSDDNQVQRSTVPKFINLICTFLLTWKTIFRIPDIAVAAMMELLFAK